MSTQLKTFRVHVTKRCLGEYTVEVEATSERSALDQVFAIQFPWGQPVVGLEVVQK